MTICLSDGILQAYLDEELGSDEAASAITHLAECSECERRLAEAEQERLQVWNALIDELPLTVPTAKLQAGLEARIARRRRSTFAPAAVVTQHWRTVVAAAAMAVAVVVVL